MARYATEKQVQKEEARTGQTVNRIAVPADDGYWIGGFKGSENDLEECVRIMNRYPEGFAYFRKRVRNCPESFVQLRLERVHD